MVKKSIARLAGYFFLILFLGFFASTTFYYHTHIENGDTIFHSHPYKKDKNGNPNHHHSAKSYLLIHIIKNFKTTNVASILFAVALLKLIYEISSGHTSSFAYLLSISPYSLRGPPVWMR
jgi:hypothetical protein